MDSLRSIVVICFVCFIVTAYADDPLHPNMTKKDESDAALTFQDYLTEKAIDARIQSIRTAPVELELYDQNNDVMINKTVTIKQTNHQFLFGCALLKWDTLPTREYTQMYRDHFKGLFNYATIPFYWQFYADGWQELPERIRKNRIHNRSRAYEWCKQNNIKMKGHPLLWYREPAWVIEKPPAIADSLIWAYVRENVEKYKGIIDSWDVVNEPVDGMNKAKMMKALAVSRLLERYGQHQVIDKAFTLANRANPNATLVINEHRRFSQYQELLDYAFVHNVPIDVIGLQSHMMHRTWDQAEIWRVCELFARYNKPIHFTEMSYPSGRINADEMWQEEFWSESLPYREAEQAERVTGFYKVLFSHPAVEAITWWNFTDHNAWQHAPIGMIRDDMTPKPLYTALKKLIRQEWWTGPLQLTTDQNGKVEFRGFLGDYKISMNGLEREFSIDKAEEQLVEIQFEK